MLKRVLQQAFAAVTIAMTMHERIVEASHQDVVDIVIGQMDDRYKVE